jgi:AcrR family transcriptional regulator
MAPRITEERWNETHQNILRTAERLFATKGFNVTSMHEIFKESGVSKGAIYNHFESKERLFLTLIDEQTEIGLEQAGTLFSEDDTYTDKVKKLIHMTFESSVNCPREMCMMQIEFMVTASRLESLQGDMQKRYLAIFDFIVELVEEGKRAGEFRQDLDARSIVTLVYATLDGLGYQYATLGLQFDAESLETVFTELIIKGIQA